MASSRPTRSQSIDSHDMQGDSDIDQDDGVTSQAGPTRRKGKGKAIKETDRKAQNRIAQREFRQRKQAYIKELEAKVKLQELGRDEQIERLGDAVKALLDENDRLRELLAGLSGFIGEGLGGALPRLKTTLPDFQALMSRSQVDVATGALRLGELSIPTNSQSRTNHDNDQIPTQQSPLHPPTHHSTYPPAHFPEAPPNHYHQAEPVTSSSHSKSTPSRSASGPAAYPAVSTAFSEVPESHYSRAPLPPPPPQIHVQNSVPLSTRNLPDDRYGQRFSDGGKESQAFASWCIGKFHEGSMEEAEAAIAQSRLEPTSNNALQAMQLISYHMKSKREHPDYTLPPSLKATPTQTLVPHSAIFDGIIFPSLRDRLILLKDQYPLEELTKDLVGGLSIHGNDLLLAENWEVDESFLRKYWFVIDETVLGIANKWRKERGERELDMKSIVPDME